MMPGLLAPGTLFSYTTQIVILSEGPLPPYRKGPQSKDPDKSRTPKPSAPFCPQCYACDLSFPL